MAKPARKAMMIGLDAPIVERLYDYAAKGELPNFAKAIANGVWARNCMNPLPTVTPPNWTTLATGAWPSTHGITCFNVHIPGTPLDETHMGFDTEEMRAEFIWEAMQRAGKKAIVLNWPSSWPSRVGEGWQVAGGGLGPNEWADGHWPFGGGFTALGSSMLIANNEYRGALIHEFRPPEAGWQGLGAGPRALQMTVPVQLQRSLYKVEPVTWHILAVDSERRGYDRVLVCESKDARKPMASLKVGEWSPTIRREFQTAAGPRMAGFKMKLLELSPDANMFRLFVTNMGALDGYTAPASLGVELAALDVLPFGVGGAFAHGGAGWFGPDTLVEMWEMHDDWLASVASYLLKNKDWSLFAMHNHLPDYFYHAFSNRIDPLYTEPARGRPFLDLERKLYQGIDRMVGRILECADDETVVVFVSDHGAKATGRTLRVNKILANAGLLSFLDEAPDDNNAHRLPPGRRQYEEMGMTRLPGDPSLIDWRRTKAYAQRTVHAYVNLRGRDPEGIVDPAEYEKVQEEIVDALLSYKDPETGRRPILLALKKEDARFTGHWGDRVGDVVFAIDPQYGDQHAPHLPTARHGVGSLRALFLMTGAGVKKGVTLERNVWIQDVVPTLCYLTGWPVPAQAEGAIVYQALEDPNS